MSTFRFALITIAVFALTYIGIAWANKGFPIMAMRAEPMKPDARVPTFEESVKKGIRKDWENSKTAQGDGDPKREALRLAALHAAHPHCPWPCDAHVKNRNGEAFGKKAKPW
jgi:hypothetical protein